jgi:hypothetical protein
LPHRYKSPRRHSYPELNHGDLVHVAGTPISFAAEIDREPANIDHTSGSRSAPPGRIVALKMIGTNPRSDG